MYEQGPRLHAWLRPLPTGRAACVFAEDIDEAVEEIEQALTCERSTPTVVRLDWEPMPPLLDELELSVRALASAARSLWPAIYANAETRELAETWQNAHAELLVTSATRFPGVSFAAARAIVDACAAGREPRFGSLPLSERVRQLALAIDPRHLVLVLAVRDPSPPEHRLLPFARGAEWLAQYSGARVVAVVRRELQGRAYLDHITYRSTTLRSRLPLPELRNVEATGAESTRERARGDVAPDVTVSPTIGRPHPNSEAEQLLYRRIQADDELQPLFSFNQIVQTELIESPRVDVLWREGKLVIEIDGKEHRSPHAFIKDRHRDYVLLVGGYRVLRLPDHEVLGDVELALTKIKNVVRTLKTESKS